MAWRWIFWVNVPIGLLTIPVAFRHVEESYGPRSAPDLAGMALLAGATPGVVWGLVRGNTAGWGSLEVVSSLVAGCGLAVGFVIWELRADAADAPVRGTGVLRR